MFMIRAFFCLHLLLFSVVEVIKDSEIMYKSGKHKIVMPILMVQYKEKKEQRAREYFPKNLIES